MINVIEDNDRSIEQIVKGFERINNDIKFEAFEKVTLKGKNTLLKKQTEKAEEELAKLKDNKKGRVANVFKIVQAIPGPKRGNCIEAYSITDPESLLITAKKFSLTMRLKMIVKRWSA
jgi:deoxyxylulose-5-phosphate synthase